MTTKRIENYLITVENDIDSENPREWDNMGTMICFHDRYNIGDKHTAKWVDDWSDFRTVLCKEFSFEYSDAVILPIYFLEHSGKSVSTTPFSCGWDSGQIGFIFVFKDNIIKEYGKFDSESIELAKSVLKGEVETYNKWLNNEVYNYEIKKIEVCNLGCEHETFIDGCGGFYDENECMSIAEHIVNDLLG
jgi:hypothetical protein